MSKYPILSATVIVILLIVINFSFAFDNSVAVLLEDESLVGSSDYTEIKTFEDQIPISITDIINNAVVLTDEETSESLTIEEDELKVMGDYYYKVKVMEDQNFGEYTSDGMTFHDNISDEFVWMVPVQDALRLRYLVTLSKDEEGKWKMAGFSDIIDPSAITYFINQNLIEKMIVESGLREVTDIEFVKLGKYSTTMIYVKSQSGEYGALFSEFVEDFGIETAKLYPIKAIAEKLGELGEVKAKRWPFTPIFIFIALIVLFLLVKLNIIKNDASKTKG